MCLLGHIHRGGEEIVAGLWGPWWQCIYSQGTESGQEVGPGHYTSRSASKDSLPSGRPHFFCHLPEQHHSLRFLSVSVIRYLDQMWLVEKHGLFGLHFQVKSIKGETRARNRGRTLAHCFLSGLLTLRLILNWLFLYSPEQPAYEWCHPHWARPFHINGQQENTPIDMATVSLMKTMPQLRLSSQIIIICVIDN